MKTRPMEAEFFRADGQTDMMTLIGFFFTILQTRLKIARQPLSLSKSSAIFISDIPLW